MSTKLVKSLLPPDLSPYSARVRSDQPTARRLTLAPPPTRTPSPRVARTGEVLDLIRRGVATTTTELATAMGLARSTVAERLELLVKQGLVMSVGETTAGRGRPSSVLAFNQRAGVTLTAQVGMSGTLTAITDLAGEVRWIEQVHLDVAEGADAMAAMLQRQFEVGLAAVDAGKRVYGIGIGLPGDIEIAARAGGTDRPWDPAVITTRLSKQFGCPVFTDRDVNYLALGEQRSTWSSSSTLLCLKVGTVIAAGLVVGGDVIRGSGGLFGEIGHSKVAGAQGPCACGGRGCLNTVAGGAVLADVLRRQGHEAHTARDVTALANRGVVDAIQVVREAGVQIGAVAASLINMLNPDVVTVWGYLADAGDQFLAGMHEAIYKGALPSSARALTLERSRLGDNAGITGAAFAVIGKTLSPELIDNYFTELAGA